MKGGNTDHRPRSVAAIAKAAAERTAAAKRKRDVIDVRDAPVPLANAPTVEQQAHADYAEKTVVDRTSGLKVGRAFTRLARFETIEGLTFDQLRALRTYRAAFDLGDLSETKSALDIRPRGAHGIEGALDRMNAIVDARTSLRRLEAAVPAYLLDTLRAVAGRDMDFKAVAIARFGGRDVSRVDATKRKPKVRVTIEPKSGKHRAIIRDEFLLAVDHLVALTTVAPVERALGLAVAVDAALTQRPAVDPAFLDDAGLMRPLDEIADIIRDRHDGSE